MAISAVGANGIGYDNIASGKKIHTAADDAAGLMIAQKQENAVRGYQAGTQNAQSGKDVIQVADGALGSVHDSLQRIRELAVKASNTAVYGADDISGMQKEVDQLKEHIQSVAKDTQFNGLKLLDGSMADMQLATNPDGTGMKIQMTNSTLEQLGIADFNLTDHLDLDTLDDAINKVSSARSSLGAQSNALGFTENLNQGMAYNLNASRSRAEDLDYGKAVPEMEKEKVLEEYRIFTQKKEEEQQTLLNRMFGTI